MKKFFKDILLSLVILILIIIMLILVFADRILKSFNETTLQACDFTVTTQLRTYMTSIAVDELDNKEIPIDISEVQDRYGGLKETECGKYLVEYNVIDRDEAKFIFSVPLKSPKNIESMRNDKGTRDDLKEIGFF